MLHCAAQPSKCITRQSNMLYVTYLHDVGKAICYMLHTYMMFYVCASSICFCSPKETIMKIRSILTCIMLSLPQYLNCKTFRCVYCFCKVVFYTHLLYLFLLWQINTYLIQFIIILALSWIFFSNFNSINLEPLLRVRRADPLPPTHQNNAEHAV